MSRDEALDWLVHNICEWPLLPSGDVNALGFAFYRLRYNNEIVFAKNVGLGNLSYCITECDWVCEKANSGVENDNS